MLLSTMTFMGCVSIWKAEQSGEIWQTFPYFLAKSLLSPSSGWHIKKRAHTRTKFKREKKEFRVEFCYHFGHFCCNLLSVELGGATVAHKLLVGLSPRNKGPTLHTHNFLHAAKVRNLEKSRAGKSMSS